MPIIYDRQVVGGRVYNAGRGNTSLCTLWTSFLPGVFASVGGGGGLLPTNWMPWVYIMPFRTGVNASHWFICRSTWVHYEQIYGSITFPGPQPISSHPWAVTEMHASARRDQSFPYCYVTRFWNSGEEPHSSVLERTLCLNRSWFPSLVSVFERQKMLWKTWALDPEKLQPIKEVFNAALFLFYAVFGNTCMLTMELPDRCTSIKFKTGCFFLPCVCPIPALGDMPLLLFFY